MNKIQMQEYQHAWYLKNKEEHDARGKAWQQIPENRKKMVKYVQKYVKANKEKVVAYNKYFEMSIAGRYRLIKFRHAKKWSDNLMSLEEFTELADKACEYCGDITNKGIDRIDNAKGYTKENSAPCCKACNMMKKTMTKDQFLIQVQKIYNKNYGL